MHQIRSRCFRTRSRNRAVYGLERVYFRLIKDGPSSTTRLAKRLYGSHGTIGHESRRVIDNYIGDSIKADFGVPLPRTAVAAVDCALAMEKELKRPNTIWQRQNFPTVEMRIGIFTGPVVAGSLGSAQRLQYTTVGDTVKIASRLESFDKDLVDPDLADSPCRILIGETTLRYLNH